MKIKKMLSLVFICMLVSGHAVYAQESGENTIEEADEGQGIYAVDTEVLIETEENCEIEEKQNSSAIEQKAKEADMLSSEENASEQMGEANSTVNAADAAGGSCGENLTWKVEGTTLSITGTGEMNDYETEGYYGGGVETDVPWEAYMNSITRVVIGEGVTTIGSCSFSDFSSLSSVSLPHSLTIIRSNAFTRCTSLVSIELPDTVIGMGAWVFGGCSSLTRITVPEGVTILNESSFSGCTALEEVYLPDGLQRIGHATFNCCKNLRKIQLPGSLRSIDTAAFFICEKLEEIQLPDSLQSIGPEAFYSCKSLKNIQLPDTINTLERETFYGCSGLTDITIPASVKTIRDQAFYGCDGLKNIYIYASMADVYGSKQIFPSSSSTTIHCLKNSGPESYLKYYGYNYSLLPCPQEEIQADAVGYKGQYDGIGHQISVSVKNLSPDQYVIYYSESENLYEGRFTHTKNPVQISDAGIHTIYYYICADGYPIKRGSADIVIEPLKASLQFKDEVVEKRVYSDSFINPLTAVTEGKITYNSSDETVAVVDNSGKVTIKGSGNCTITASAAAGNYTVATASYILKVAELLELKILQHPKDINGQLGEQVILKVKASGDELTYQWRYSFDGEVSDTKYGLFGGNSDTLQLTLTDRASGAVYWCHIKDRFGNECNTEPCRLNYTIKNGYVSSGVCGEHLTWTLDDKGTLRISGKGEMTASPWADEGNQLKTKISKVIIQNGVTSIKSFAFYECTLADVYIPDSVTSIGDVAFYGCWKLEEVTIPVNAGNMGAEVFGECYNLRKVVMSGNAPKDTDIFGSYGWRPYDKIIIHVPEGAKGYESKPWCDYKIVYDVKSVDYKKGDVNIDGNVNIEDLRIVLRYVCGKTELKARQEEAADVVSDGMVDIQDLRQMLRYVCGKVKEL